ncbi:S1 RNA-binding domain-containing protein [Streptomyces sp. NPDC057445]|uniref:S1 RNA-binding domain-containing protein n=1 Tax=Streptomyces sp. NPDC057445 TaxID=3346136 RepID=UPI0036A714DD
MRTGLDPGGEARAAFLRTLEKGEVRHGVVSGTESFGVFVELGGGADGFINCAELTWSSGGFSHTSEIVSVGQEITATVLDVDRTRLQAQLSLKDLEQDPLRDFARTQLGRTVPGVVTRLLPMGAFVRVHDGVVGLVPVAELAEPWPQVGDEVRVEVTGVNVTHRRVGLALRQAVSSNRSVTGKVAE